MAPDQHLDANRVSAWLEGGLGAAERVRVTAHLNRCPECRRIAACAGILLWDAARPPRRAAQFWLPPLALAASLVLVAGLGWPWLQTQVPAVPAANPTLPPPAAVVTSPTAAKVAQPRLAKRKPHSAPVTARPVALPMAPPAAAAQVPPTVVSSIHFSPSSTGFADQPPQFGAQQALTAWGGTTQALPISSPPSLASRLSYASDETLDFSQASTGSALNAWSMGWADTAAGAAPSLRVAGQVMRVETEVAGLLWAAARSDQVYSSADHGAHWHAVVLPGAAQSPATVLSIKFQDPEDGSIRDRRGFTWLTHDGGITWARH